MFRKTLQYRIFVTTMKSNITKKNPTLKALLYALIAGCVLVLALIS